VKQRTDDMPAILGGKRAVTVDEAAANRWPILTGEDEDAVLNIIRHGDISTHPVYRGLEDDYRKFTGQPYALAHCNGTAALLAAFFSLDLKPGDEVLVPSATFWASVLPMLWLGAIPVFCESEGERLGLDPDDLERKVTSRTRAVMVVHLWGMPSKMTEIFAFAAKHDLKVIEDASHAQGALWRDRLCGALGDISVFSLQGGKLAPAGEGGMFLCKNYETYEKAVCLGDITRIVELETPARRFAATSFGVKTRIAPMSAAIARIQLKHLEENNRRRNGNLEYLSSALEEMGFHTFLPPAHIRRVYFEFLIRTDAQKIGLPTGLLIEALQAEGCTIGLPRYPLLHQQPFFTEGHYLKIARPDKKLSARVYRGDELPETEKLSHSMLKLPSFPVADQEILDQYILAFNKVFTWADTIKKRRGS
jgi:Predicted pyridoxal phosphate-dependent enzyme apparently involved in regulation of cell wall biogenesis